MGTAVFFVHSAIRLWIMARKGGRPFHESSRHNRIPSTAGPEGFKPNRPIPVQLARDDEIAALDEEGLLHEEKLEAIKMPPPAYGLWRESVVSIPSPNLSLYNQLTNETSASTPISSTGNASATPLKPKTREGKTDFLMIVWHLCRILDRRLLDMFARKRKKKNLVEPLRIGRG